MMLRDFGGRKTRRQSSRLIKKRTDAALALTHCFMMPLTEKLRSGGRNAWGQCKDWLLNESKAIQNKGNNKMIYHFRSKPVTWLFQKLGEGAMQRIEIKYNYNAIIIKLDPLNLLSFYSRPNIQQHDNNHQWWLTFKKKKKKAGTQSLQWFCKPCRLTVGSVINSGASEILGIRIDMTSW